MGIIRAAGGICEQSEGAAECTTSIIVVESPVLLPYEPSENTSQGFILTECPCACVHDFTHS